MKVFRSAFALLSLLTLPFAVSAALPVSQAPLERGGAERLKTEMLVSPMKPQDGAAEKVVFRSGTKTLQVSGSHAKKVGLYVITRPACYGVLYLDDGREPLATLVLSCGNEWSMHRSEPGDRMSVDREKASVTWSRPYTLHDKTTATSSYTVSVLPDGRLAIDYDFGIDEARAAAFDARLPFACRLVLEEYEEGTRAFGFGEAEHECVSDAAIEAANRKFLMTPVGRLTTPVFNFERRDPLKAWSLAFPSVAVAERFFWDESHTKSVDVGGQERTMRAVSLRDSAFGCLQKGNPRQRPTKGRFILDLGKGAVRKVAPQPAVGGIDFWGQDALHVPVRPTRNQLVNGSFEQGFKGWRWEDGGAWWSPSDLPREEIIEGGRFGKHALLLRPVMSNAPDLCSQAMALEDGKRYVLSFYAKHTAKAAFPLRMRMASVAKAGKDYFNKKAFAQTKPVVLEPGDWRRYEVPFVADSYGYYVSISPRSVPKGAELLIDGIVVEQAEKAGEYVDDPYQAKLVSNRAPYNDLRPGEDYGLRLEVSEGGGERRWWTKDGLRSSVRVRIENFYGEVKVDRTFKLSGPATLPLAVDPVKLGKGIFVVRMDYSIQAAAKGLAALPSATPNSQLSTLNWTDYARFSVLEPLANKHPTAQFYANHPMWFVRSSRLPDIMRKFVEWGWGSLANAASEITRDDLPWAQQMRELGIRNYIHELSSAIENGRFGFIRRPAFAAYTNVYSSVWSGYRQWKKIEPVHLEFFEKAAYQQGLELDPRDDIFALAGEEEGWVRDTVGWEAHWKCVEAMMRGAKRAFAERGLPPPKFISSQGTSHYFAGRNYDAIDGFLGTAKKHGVKYDAVAIHPYSNIDTGILGPNDADKETKHLIDQMKSYGYDEKTPIYFAECFNMLPWRIPRWGCDGWGDGFRRNKAPTQARGVREFTMAASQARLYILALKYWPQVCLVHAWNCEPFMDIDLSPLSHILAANTLGHLMADPQWIGDAQPYGDVRGYCFRRKDRGDIIMPVWTTNNEVEFGEKKGTVLEMTLPGDVTFIDLEGNVREAEKVEKVGGGGQWMVRVPLTPAPLFLVSKDGEGLLKGLRESVADDPSMAFSARVRPDLSGKLNLELENLTSRRRTGTVEAGGVAIAYDVAGHGRAAYPIKAVDAAPMTLQSWKGRLAPLFARAWNVEWFFVPRCGEKPDWSKVPAMPFTARQGKGRCKPIAARCQYAWNDEFLFLRVAVDDPAFVPASEDGKSFAPTALYNHDGSLEVYFDGFANARSQGEKGYDDDDSRYDLLETNIHRLRAVNMQLAQGTTSATDAEIREKLVRNFTRTEKGYVYEIAFAARYMAPVDLKAGTVFGAGVALNAFTRDDKSKDGWSCQTLSTSVDKSKNLNVKPYLMPLAILAE